MTQQEFPALCDYEGSAYEREFWTRARVFEDLAERVALRRLLPPRGGRLVEIGAGFGRLAGLYAGYDEVVLVEPALSLLAAARQHLGYDRRFIFVRGNSYNLPLNDAVCDTVVMVRVLHHLADVPAALSELRRVLRPHATLVMEYANKRNLKSIVRFLLRRQAWSPFALDPYEFVTLNFDFHPQWVAYQLRDAGFRIQEETAVSHLRAAFFKGLLAPARLAALDGYLQRYASPLKLAPSVFVRAQAAGAAFGPHDDLFRCPVCHHAPLRAAADALHCPACGARWPQVDGIYDFGSA